MATLAVPRTFRPCPRRVARLDLAAHLAAAAAAVVVLQEIPGRTTHPAAAEEEAVDLPEAEGLQDGQGLEEVAVEDIPLTSLRARADHRVEVADRLTTAAARLVAGETTPSTGCHTTWMSRTDTSGRRK